MSRRRPGLLRRWIVWHAPDITPSAEMAGTAMMALPAFIIGFLIGHLL